MWSVRPFNAECGDISDGRAVEGFMPRLFGRLSAALVRPEAFPVPLARPTFVRLRVEDLTELCNAGNLDPTAEWTCVGAVAIRWTPPEG